MGRALRWIGIAVCIGVIAFCAIQILPPMLEYRRAEKHYEELQQYVSIPQEELDSDKSRIVFPEVDHAALQAINSEYIGWLYGQDGSIDYPVVQGANNRYYLKHAFDHSKNSSGALFMECENAPDFSDMNTIIYGHHMKNGKMFASLSEYQEQAYYDSHPYLLLMTPEKNYVIRVFAGYVSAAKGDAWKISIGDEAVRAEWLQQLQDRSCFVSTVEPSIDDRFITLSTCNYEYKNARFVLFGVLEEQE